MKNDQEWVGLGEAADGLGEGELRTVKRHGHALVVGRDTEGCVFALDNRCPHEGYPLATGTLQGNALTCCWHNWKFDVRDGACTLGGEAVRHFDVREHDGELQVDLTPPDPSVIAAAGLESLRAAMLEHDNGRALRDSVRVLATGYDPNRLLAEVAAWDAEYAEYGTTHALAVAADCGRAVGRGDARYRGVHAVEAVAPAIDMAGEANRRLPARSQPAPIPGADRASLRASVEAEDAQRAEALLLGAFDAGVERVEIERWLCAILSDHFLDFGHRLIYFIKTRELLDRVGDDYARRLYPALLYSIVLGTREDTLPYMAGYSRRTDAAFARTPDIAGASKSGTHFDREACRDAVLDATTIEAAFDAVWKPLEAGVPADEIARVLVIAAAHRLWRFDEGVDRDTSVVENWLFVTHRFTFACAVRQAIAAFPSRDSLRFLFQAVAFVHTGRKMDRGATEHALPSPLASNVEGILDAIADKDANLAVARVLGFVESGAPLAELHARIEDLCLQDPLVRPIAVAHAIKTVVCAFEEYDALADQAERIMPLVAVVRFLASPLIERRVHETAVRSIRWVAEGTMPRKLTQ